MVKARNDLAHGREVDEETLATVELETRDYAREAIRRELENRGVKFDHPPSTPTPGWIQEGKKWWQEGSPQETTD